MIQYKDKRRYVWWKCNYCGQVFPTVNEHPPGHGVKKCKVCLRTDWKYEGHGRKGEPLIIEEFNG